MKKVLIFSLVYYPRFIGGAEVAIKEITDRINPRDVEFDMITLRLDKRLPKFEKIGNVNVYRIGWAGKQSSSSDSLPFHLHLNKYFFLLLGPIKARALNKKRKYDTLWSLMATYNTFAALFFKILKPKIKFVFTLQDGDPIPYLKSRALPLYPFFKMFFTRANHIQAISQYLADWAKEMGAKCPISVVPNAVDVELFSKVDSEGVKKLMIDLDKKASDFFLITTSRLVLKNGVSDIVFALTFLPSNIKLLILGQGYEEKNLRHLVQKLNIIDRVKFCGYISHKDMPKYLQISDAFIRPSLSEGLGNSFLEAMAAGLPVIGTPVGGIPDFLKDGETGLFCEVQNPKSIAEKVEKLTVNQELKEKLIQNGKSLVTQNYRWEIVAEKMQKILI